MSDTHNRTRVTDASYRFAVGLYCFMLALYLLAAFFPESRVWGLNIWAYFPVWVPLVLLVIGLIALELTARLKFTDPDRQEVKPGPAAISYGVFSVAITVILGLAFYLLRARTFFFGDGYQELVRLATDNFIVKPSSPGTVIVVRWLKSAVGGDSTAAVLFSYQAVAVFSGLCFTVAVALVSRRLFVRNTDRILFLSGLVSGGYMLLFFGCVENYALFATTVGVFTLLGLLVAQRRLAAWWLIPVVALSVCWHVFGVVLIPAAVYLLVVNTKLGRSIARIQWKTKALLLLLAGLPAALVFFYFLNRSLYFRFAMVPLVAHRFTPEGYTLFSLAHMVDFVNLLLLMVPGLLVLLVMLPVLPLKHMSERLDYRYLTILALSALGAAFVVDPKLGMARDWDLLSFCGIPMVTFMYFAVLDGGRRVRHGRLICVLAIVLGFVVLFPRALWLTDDGVSVAHFEDYLRQDRLRNRNSWIHLVNFHKERGDTVRAEDAFRRWKTGFPEELMIARANELYYKEKDLPGTMELLRRIIDINPTYADAYDFLGFCHIHLNQLDTAVVLLRLAVGLMPYRATTLTSLGTAFMRRGDYAEAEDAYLEAVALDPASLQAVYSLAHLYRTTGRMNEYREYLEKAGAVDGAPEKIIKELITVCLTYGDTEKAAELLRNTPSATADTVFMAKMRKIYPLWDSFLHEQVPGPSE